MQDIAQIVLNNAWSISLGITILLPNYISTGPKDNFSELLGGLLVFFLVSWPFSRLALYLIFSPFAAS